ncbi:MAG: response regulator [Legionella sp.]
MRVLIIEDNAFNAFCLCRLLESAITSVSTTVVSNSQDALSVMEINVHDLVIIDGELNLIDEMSTHGPQLAAVLLQKYPHLPLISWSDSEFMRSAFAKIFIQHNRLVNEYNTWTKAVSLKSIHKTWTYYFGEAIGEKKSSFAHLTQTQIPSGYRIDCL